MDYQFPQQLFPSYFFGGPPDWLSGHGSGKLCSYGRVKPQGGPGLPSSWTSKHQARGDTWCHTEPVPLPLLSPKHSFLWSSTPPDPLDFTEHMQNFFVDHCQDAFCNIGELLADNFCFEKTRRKGAQRDSVCMWRVKNFLDMLKYKICPLGFDYPTMNAYSVLLADSVHAVPPELLSSLLYEELTEQRDRLLFSESTTGGALAFIPFSSPNNTDSKPGCLVYPGNRGLDRLNFHRVALLFRREQPVCLDTSSHKARSFQLKGPIKQISAASVFDHCCVGVRSDYLCGLWRFHETNEPRLLEVVKTKEVVTCVSVSPHVSGEVLVTSESGAANLWTVGKGTQKVRQEDSNLYFNAKSSWRWCHFSAHPRVMVYADRTGAELTDIRLSPSSSHTLFRISKTSECCSGERLLLSRHLDDIHSFHHLITTQNSAYIVDERFPCIPMLKWDHMMLSPPVFCDVLPGSVSTVGGARTTNILLGSQRSQEVVLLQYSGGGVDACSSHGPPQTLLKPSDVLKHLPGQIPHRRETASNRLSSAAAGLSCIQMRSGAGGSEDCICVLQLTEVGDIFYQTLVPQQSDFKTSRLLVPEEEPPSQQKTLDERTQQPATPPESQLLFLDSSSDDDVIAPTQNLKAQKKEDAAVGTDDDTSSEDAESDRKRPNLKGLQVVINDDPDQLDVSTDLIADCTEGCGLRTRSSRSPRCVAQQTVPTLSDDALATWKRWLQKMIQKAQKISPRPNSRENRLIKNSDLFCAPDDMARSLAMEDQRRALRACMAKRSLLVGDTVSASHSSEKTPPLLNLVDTDAWTDDLSQRLTLSWQGDEGWREWWEDRLGLNREEREEKLRRRRRKDKEARRIARQQMALSRSFTSSISYQMELDDLTDWKGWSSEASQGVWSDAEGMSASYQQEGSLVCETPRATTLTDTAAATVTPRTPRAATPTAKTLSTRPGTEEQHCGQLPTIPSSAAIFSLSQPSEPDSAPVTQRTKRPHENYFNPLLALQDDPSHNDYFLEPEGNTAATSSQLIGSRISSHRGLCLSQNSLGQRTQASHPKKKSRMGF
ncbi:TATA box-binding protein-associated factor RNA polymerase I subunit C [Thalassophryne amazonica]|uniref:TATA box-binding protein-associated factor RNA polymerase I subunit C n=1 Tax=Thalassophryne amazonica TaxID=390379 RepID=UPI0014718500|nr:TATA box-binding protein-associated factor RNA polymerase I subunit C [Thalassophryne amazonica]XP_034047665.1 TATA box-binding protein-associated factor RNA polymerase I subunit C [Thalassophryne amazonica]